MLAYTILILRKLAAVYGILPSRPFKNPNNFITIDNFERPSAALLSYRVHMIHSKGGEIAFSYAYLILIRTKYIHAYHF